ncbi:MAG: hypothetical protein ACFCUN_06500 [Hyphomicrobiaceae bacterium]
MVDRLADIIQDPAAELAAILLAMVLLAGPMIWLAIWYHRTLRKTADGRALLDENSKWPANPHRLSARSLTGAARMARDIQRGRYGAKVRAVQKRTYWVIGLWVCLNVAAFALLFAAQERNKARAAQQQPSALKSQPSANPSASEAWKRQ